MIFKGDLEGGVEHLSLAISLCSAPVQLMEILRQTLPPQAYTMLAHKLAEMRVTQPSSVKKLK